MKYDGRQNIVNSVIGSNAAEQVTIKRLSPVTSSRSTSRSTTSSLPRLPTPSKSTLFLVSGIVSL